MSESFPAWLKNLPHATCSKFLMHIHLGKAFQLKETRGMEERDFYKRAAAVTIR